MGTNCRLYPYTGIVDVFFFMDLEAIEYSKAISFIESDRYLNPLPTDAFNIIKLSVEGKKDTFYDGGKFKFTIKLDGVHFPFIRCDTLVWHPNIDPMMPPNTTNICNHVHNVNNWDEEKNDVIDVIKMLKGLIHMESPYYIGCEHPLNDEITPKNFERKARSWTKSYAV